MPADLRRAEYVHRHRPIYEISRGDQGDYPVVALDQIIRSIPNHNIGIAVAALDRELDFIFSWVQIRRFGVTLGRVDEGICVPDLYRVRGPTAAADTEFCSVHPGFWTEGVCRFSVRCYSMKTEIFALVKVWAVFLVNDYVVGKFWLTGIDKFWCATDVRNTDRTDLLDLTSC